MRKQEVLLDGVPADHQAPAALWRYREAAAFLGLSEITLRRFVMMKRIPHMKIGGKAVRFNPAALKQWAQAQEVTR